MVVTFTQEMINGAILTEQQTGVPASITLGQLVLESGYRSPADLSGLAKNYHNYFGVKAIGGWTGATTPYMTNSKGQDGAVYRAYSSAAEGFTDHAKILQNERYQKYFREAKSIEDYAWGLQKGGYATAPNYASSLINVIKSNNLTQYDGKTSTGTLSGVTETVTNPVTFTDTAEPSGISGILFTGVYFVVLLAILIVAVATFLKTFKIQIPKLDIKKLAKGGGKDE